MKINNIELFAGAGGLVDSLEQSGNIQLLSAVEWLKPQVRTLVNRLESKYNIQDAKEIVLNFDIQRTEELINVWSNEEEFGGSPGLAIIVGNNEVLMISGGPPCQAYSLVGRARDENGMVGDSRNYLYILYAEFLRKYHPRYFVFENVTGLLSAKDTDGKLYFDKMRQLFRECGYSIEFKQLNAKDYGVLQNRSRIILIGKYGQHEGFYPNIPEVTNSCTVEEIFKDLP